MLSPLLSPIVPADIILTSEFVEPLKNWSFEGRDYSIPGDGVYRCPPWESNNNGRRELRGDVNGDKACDVFDKLLVGAAFGANYNPTDEMYWHGPPDFPGPCPYCPHPPNTDLNGDGTVDLFDKVIVNFDFGKETNPLDGSYSWYTNGGGDYQMWQWLDNDIVEAIKGKEVTFSFWFLPESVASNGSENIAEARIYYEYSGGSNTTYGVQVCPTETRWHRVLVSVALPDTTTAVKVIIHGFPDFKAWIDNADFREKPYAYSTDYEFDVPSYSDALVTYHHEIEVYVWDYWHMRDFWFKAVEVDDWVSNVKIDGDLKYSGSTPGPLNVDLGNLAWGYHTLEFNYAEQLGDGKMKFFVALDGDPEAGEAGLVQFTVEVPDDGDNEVRYTVATTTWINFKDDYFMIGYADDFIDDFCLDGTVWQDWEWDCSPYDTVYAWGDGFCYPMGNLDKNIGTNSYDISFKFGEINATGLLDFQYVSWSKQKDRIGPPKFYSETSITNLGGGITLNEGVVHGSAEWKSPTDPAGSERSYEIRVILDVNYTGAVWWNASLEISLANMWAEWGLIASGHDDIGIPLNFTLREIDTNLILGRHQAWYYYCAVGLYDYTIDVYSFPHLTITGLEYDTGDSGGKIDPGFIIAADFGAETLAFIAAVLATRGTITPVQALLGSTVGFGIKGVASYFKFLEGQEVSRYTTTLEEDHHWQLSSYKPILSVGVDTTGSVNKSVSDLIFFGLDPSAEKHTGLTKVVLAGKLKFYHIIITPWDEVIPCSWEIGYFEVELCIPWFIHPLPT